VRIVGLEKAVADLVRDGDTAALGCFAHPIACTATEAGMAT
jgi:hypothetical protein